MTTATKPKSCGDCPILPLWQPYRWIGWCPKRQARRDHAAKACEEAKP